MGSVDFFVGECLVRVLVREAKTKAFFVFSQGWMGVEFYQGNAFDEVGCLFVAGFEQSVVAEGDVTH